MWARRYFPGRYYAPRYFGGGGTAAVSALVGALHIYINSVVCSANLMKQSLEIVNALNQEPDTASFTVRDLAPVIGQEVIVELGTDSRLFGGVLQGTVRQSRVRSAGRILYDCDCVDYTRFLDRRLANAAFTSWMPHSIVSAVIGSFTSGFTVSGVSNSFTAALASVELSERPISEALTEIGDAAGAAWYVDYAKDVHFFPNTLGEATIIPDTLTGTNTAFQHLEITRDLSQSYTRVRVAGAGSTSEAETEPVGATDLAVYACSAFSSVSGQVKVGYQTISYTGKTSGDGQGFLQNVPASGPGSIQTALHRGDKVSLLVTVNDTAAQTALGAIEGGDGIYELFVEDDSLTEAAATARANAELEHLSDPAMTITYQTRDRKTLAGRHIGIDIASPVNISSMFQIQRVTMNQFQDGERVYPMRTVEAAPARPTDLMDVLRVIEPHAYRRTKQ